MTDDTEALDDEPPSDIDDAPKRRFSGKQLVLFVVLPLVLLIGGGAAAFFLGLFDSPPAAVEEAETGAEGEAETQEARGPGHFHTLPELLVNLTPDGRQQRFLKITVSLELESAGDATRLQERLPRVMDHFQTYLRNLRVEDLRGSAGVYRLRQELLARVRPAVEPIPVHDVLFQEILIQ